MAQSIAVSFTLHLRCYTNFEKHFWIENNFEPLIEALGFIKSQYTKLLREECSSLTKTLRYWEGKINIFCKVCAHLVHLVNIAFSIFTSQPIIIEERDAGDQPLCSAHHFNGVLRFTQAWRSSCECSPTFEILENMLISLVSSEKRKNFPPDTLCIALLDTLQCMRLLLPTIEKYGHTDSHWSEEIEFDLKGLLFLEFPVSLLCPELLFFLPIRVVSLYIHLGVAWDQFSARGAGHGATTSEVNPLTPRILSLANQVISLINFRVNPELFNLSPQRNELSETNSALNLLSNMMDIKNYRVHGNATIFSLYRIQLATLVEGAVTLLFCSFTQQEMTTFSRTSRCLGSDIEFFSSKSDTTEAFDKFMSEHVTDMFYLLSLLRNQEKGVNCEKLTKTTSSATDTYCGLETSDLLPCQRTAVTLIRPFHSLSVTEFRKLIEQLFRVWFVYTLTASACKSRYTNCHLE